MTTIAEVAGRVRVGVATVSRVINGSPSVSVETRRRVNAVIFTSSALGVLEAAEAAGVRVPDEPSVVGFDDIEVARYAGLTTIAQPLEGSGVRGARLMLRAMDGAPRVAQRLPLGLRVRATTGPAGPAMATGMSRRDGIIRPT